MVLRLQHVVQPVCLVSTAILYTVADRVVSSPTAVERTNFQHGATAENIRVRDHPDLAPHAGPHAYHAGQRLIDG